MSALLPDALRTRLQQYIEVGLSGRAAASRLQLYLATRAQWARVIRGKGRAEAAPRTVSQRETKRVDYRLTEVKKMPNLGR